MSLLTDLLLRAAGSNADGDAVRFRGRALTYAQAASAALAFGGSLRSAGVVPGDRVAICLPKGVEMLPAVYGTMAAGACYVPLDPKAPARRGAAVARDCGIRALLGTPSLAAPLLTELGADRPEVLVLVEDEGTPGGDLAAEAASGTTTIAFADAVVGPETAPVTIDEDDLAYILYTSGSTGVPKGVMLSHANALAFVSWAAGAIGSAPGDVFSNHAPLHFDLSVFDLYVAAHGAAAVCPVPEEIAYLPGSLVAFVAEQAVSVWYSVPSALVRLAGALTDPDALSSLRALVFAGEVFPTKDLRRLRGLVPDAELWNLYGPTETNVVSAHRVEEVPPDDAPIPIGRACSGARLTVVGDDGSPVADGEPGELLVSGPTLMRGYWGAPERTAEALVPDPITGRTAYRTGDLVRLRPDGSLAFIGRRDHQVKSRGYRIELGEVEASLSSHTGIAEVVVVGAPHEVWGTELVAYVVPNGAEPLTPIDVKRHVAGALPRYMVPTTVYVVDEIEHTATGKPDRPALVRRHAEAGAR